MGGQHLAMGVNVHAGPHSLLQKLLQVVEVVAGDQNGGVIPHAQVHPVTSGWP